MNIISFNIRGSGSSLKRKKGNKYVEWTASHSQGASGGMAILWRKFSDSVFVNYSFSGLGYVGINVNWKGVTYNLVNIYASCQATERRSLWSNLVERKLASGNIEWCLGGDFNEVIRRERMRLRGSHSSRNMADFRRFIEDMDLMDVACIGGRFTWYKGNGTTMSHLDRFLVSNNMIEDWSFIDQRVGERDVSDHCHIWLNVGKLDRGPKPFRFINTWFNHEGFFPFLKEEWGKLEVQGRGNFVLYEKLRRMKLIIKKRNRDIFGWINLHVSEKVDNLNFLDIMIVEHREEDISSMVEDRYNVTGELWKSLRLKEGMLRLKSRQLWLKEGNKNSRFFHNSLRNRRRRRRIAITSIMGRRGLVEGVAEVKEELKSNFEEFFRDSSENRRVPAEVNFNRLSEEDNFQKDARLTKAVSSSFITLVPKIANPQALHEFIPICLVGSLHKILSKLVAAKIKVVIENLVLVNQLAFVPGRNILDRVLLINEALDMDYVCFYLKGVSITNEMHD
ncbi:uncharacterized protein LOC131639797 [Vicia villosa]|uniref:uncharacterized protein LOC131639797 n=1 Tax=Vicia villosa TaxID=3911 RepID=UPI00273C40B5|nr:uncharacterized protein LOC131639797 [Vicia villosa]